MRDSNHSECPVCGNNIESKESEFSRSYGFECDVCGSVLKGRGRRRLRSAFGLIFLIISAKGIASPDWEITSVKGGVFLVLFLASAFFILRFNKENRFIVLQIGDRRDRNFLE